MQLMTKTLEMSFNEDESLTLEIAYLVTDFLTKE